MSKTVWSFHCASNWVGKNVCVLKKYVAQHEQFKHKKMSTINSVFDTHAITEINQTDSSLNNICNKNAWLNIWTIEYGYFTSFSLNYMLCWIACNFIPTQKASFECAVTTTNWLTQIYSQQIPFLKWLYIAWKLLGNFQPIYIILSRINLTTIKYFSTWLE